MPGIITCSALKRRYRDVLREKNVIFVHLDGSRELLGRRLAARLDHYMPPSLLDSQVATLEVPGDDERAITIDAGRAPAEEAAEVVRRLGSPRPRRPPKSFGGSAHPARRLVELRRGGTRQVVGEARECGAGWRGAPSLSSLGRARAGPGGRGRGPAGHQNLPSR
ncbi:gluconokinase [Cryobacterium sp. Sr8]|uniref:gluconokinase n=1 Tax=Cryobacterium sp. Sr8 TaxID=1259203 RepID=UPI0015840C94|nr:hypothetical protein [Cryobacterium sp. Sr8]